MGHQEEIEAKLADKPVSKIHGQPTDKTITRLERELTEITSSVPTSLGGGKHGHARIVIHRDCYITFSNGGAEFTIPAHPGYFPTTVSSVAGTRDKQFAAHKGKIIEYELCAGVINACKNKIKEAVNKE